MSGGVDSTLCAILLQKEGYEVVGIYMKLHDNELYHQENFAKVQRVAKYLGIKTHFHDLSGDFKDNVYDYFVGAYKSGITPNPCVMCNRTIKFGAMIDFADTLGIEKIATGHYLKSDNRFIYKAIDDSKDQSYFLAEVKKEVIPRLLFPLGDCKKDDVKAMVSEIPLLQDIATQKESSEICFVDNDYTEILEKHMNIDQEGDVLRDGEVVGRHKGYMHYTIGKRRGFTVDGAHDPHYVIALDPDTNSIEVGTHDKLSEDEFDIKQINLFEDLTDFNCQVKVRYRTEGVNARVVIDSDIGRVVLEKEVYGLAKGQFAVFYDNDRLLGGGIIV